MAEPEIAERAGFMTLTPNYDYPTGSRILVPSFGGSLLIVKLGSRCMISDWFVYYKGRPWRREKEDHETTDHRTTGGKAEIVKC
jgi:hypothetical protein